MLTTEHDSAVIAHRRHRLSVTTSGLLKAEIQMIIGTAIAIALGIGTSHAGTSKNGTSKNGTSKNGTSKNGTSENGTSKNGTSKNGTSKNGTSKNGTSKNGTSENGTSERMSGARFVGYRANPATGGIQVVEVVRFGGTTLNVRRWRASDGWTGDVIHARELVGIAWREHICDQDGACTLTEYRVESARMDESNNTMHRYHDNRDIWIYQVASRSIPDADDDESGHRWKNPCGSNGSGLFVDGQWNRDGSFSSRGFTFSCLTGAIAKCAQRWGYKPWKTLVADDGKSVDIGPLHRACVRATRADYCGNGISYTRDGTVIDMFDRYGFNTRDPKTGFSLEAEFTSEGARWMSRPRWAASVLGASPTCIAESGRSTGSAASALIFVWSAH